MKRFFRPLALLLLAGALFSCEKDRLMSIEDEGPVVNPLANFEVTKDPADGFSYSFKNLSSNYEKLEWRFGDDTLSTLASPSHVYLTTGKFQVDLKAFSSTGAVTRKLVDINIVADSVAKVTAVKTGVLNQVKFGISVKAKIKTIMWTFLDVTPNVQSSSMEPVRNYNAGSFNAFSVRVETEKGSVINLSKFVTPEGIAENITQNYTSFTASTNNSNTNENAAKLVDNNLDTKIYLGGPPLPLTFKFQYASAQTVKIYAIGSANDSDTRDPKIWTMEGSNDDNVWTVLDSRTQTSTFYAQAGNQFKKLFYFTIAEPKPFVYYRWRITSMSGSANFQASEIRLFR
ncbi:MAG: PKD domain-containing protein [Pedobacter sp.]|nr:PKD domain-containing protein [Pedobacter sp.]